MNQLLVTFIVADIFITAAVLIYVFKRRRASGQIMVLPSAASATIEGFRALAAFAKEQHERIGNYMQANWSGAPENLPTVLSRLLDAIEQDAKAKGITADRETLKMLLSTSLRSHKIGSGREVRDALAKVA